MNDCKYGHRIKGNTLDLNLLRGAQHPGAVVFDDSKLKPGEYNHKYGDQGDHEFTYSLYPHAGDHVEGRVMQAAYELNIPMRSLVRFAGAGKAAVRLPSSASLIAVSSPDVIVEAVKTAEDGDDMIVRLYEAAKATTCATVRFGLPVKSVDEVDLMEENPVRLKLNGNSVKLDFHPFEIKTIKVRT
jgi:alpha-mannosidase